MTFDPNKPVKQRNGRPARIICKDAKGDKPIVALINYSIDEESQHYFPNGQFSPCGESSYDLINIEEPKLQLPITPGRYRMRNGRIAIIGNVNKNLGWCTGIAGSTPYPTWREVDGCWKNYIGLCEYDLIERLPDEPRKNIVVSLESLNTKLDELLRRMG